MGLGFEGSRLPSPPGIPSPALVVHGGFPVQVLGLGLPPPPVVHGLWSEGLGFELRLKGLGISLCSRWLCGGFWVVGI